MYVQIGRFYIKLKREWINYCFYLIIIDWLFKFILYKKVL